MSPSRPPCALITGITGQDGSYLAEFLLEKGYDVHGLVRRASTFNTERLEGVYQDPHEKGARLHLHYGDLADGQSLTNLVLDVEPDEIYNLENEVGETLPVGEVSVEIGRAHV